MLTYAAVEEDDDEQEVQDATVQLSGCTKTEETDF